MNKKASILKTLLQYLGLFVLIFVVVYGFINAPAIITNINYYLSNPEKAGTDVLEISENGSLPNVKQKKTLQSNYLYIPKINVSAQITWNVPQAQEVEKLKSSVIHMEKTALPGHTGNVFITGHSSYYWWLGKYTNIFALLPKLQKGDRIAITYGNKIYTYKVKSIYVVSPSNLEVTNQGKTKELTLMTCVPIGTNLNRLIVKADQIGVSNR